MSGVSTMMKRLIATLALLLAWTALAGAAPPPAPLTTLHEIHSLSIEEADKSLPVAFEATVTYFDGPLYTLFVQDGGEGIYVTPQPGVELIPGDRILIRGKTGGVFRPNVINDNIVLLHHGAVPKPVPATFDDLIHVRYDGVLVSVRGVVRTADKRSDQNTMTSDLLLLTEGGTIKVLADRFSAKELEALLDAEVEITGVAGGQFDGKTQMRGIQFSVSSPADVKILKYASASPWSLPLIPMDQIMTGYHVTDRSQRLRVHGTVTYYEPGSAVVLQNGPKSLWIDTNTSDPIEIGDVADATGFPASHNGFLALAQGEINDSHVQAPVAPLLTTHNVLASSAHIIDLVTVEALVVSEARGGAQDEYGLTADGQLFSAIYRHSRQSVLPPMKPIPIGSRVRVTGICITEDANPFNGQVPFEILMRSFDDISVVARASLVNTRNLLLVLGLLLVVVFGVIARGWALEHKVRRQTAVMSALREAEAELERRRSSILEDINGSRPLAEILEEIAAMVSSTLEGAPCWCEVADGARLGSYPQDPQNLRIVLAEIPARSGPALGTLYAGLDPQTPPLGRETVTLQNGARLATLAIETRRLYTDLRRRSEFDLLTDIPNRFALEKFMELQIGEARLSGRIMGLIYIDLDKFKPINDTYGHHVGDLFLQAVAKRMSRQLLGSDMLARLGGDEFAALVSLHHGRSDLDVIVARLESCFDEPFSVEGNLLHGEASIGFAFFPEDGATKDSLLSAADAAMYAVKNTKKNFEKSMEPILPSEL